MKFESHPIFIGVMAAAMACTDPGNGYGTSAGDELGQVDDAPPDSSDTDAGSESAGGGGSGQGGTDTTSDSESGEDGGTDETGESDGGQDLPPFDEEVRVAQWDVALAASASKDDVERVAKLIALVNPDIMLVNGIDDSHIELLGQLLGIEGEGDIQGVPLFTHMYAPMCNQGIGEPGEQPCMVLLSSHEIVPDKTLTFQEFSWCEIPEEFVPESLAPTPCDINDPATRLFSTTFADVTVRFNFDPQKLIHVLMTHATEPSADDELARKRNNDQIRFINDYIDELSISQALTTPNTLDDIQGIVPVPTSIPYGYFCDDLYMNACAPLGPRPFVVLGNLNADDGLLGAVWNDGVTSPAIHVLLKMERVLDYVAPQSEGAGLDNPDATYDHPEGSRRADYVLPSVDFEVTDSGVLWLTPDDPGFAYVDSLSHHHLTWVDLQPAS